MRAILIILLRLYGPGPGRTQLQRLSQILVHIGRQRQQGLLKDWLSTVQVEVKDDCSISGMCHSL